MTNNEIIDANKLSQLTSSIGSIKLEMRTCAMSFFRIGEKLFNIQESEVYKIKGYKSFVSFCKGEFGISKVQSYRFVGIYKKFSSERYSSFTYSQLIEMLSLKDSDIDKVNPGMTVKEIRTLKKDLKESKEKEDIQFGEQTVVDIQESEVVEVPEKTDKEIIEEKNLRISNQELLIQRLYERLRIESKEKDKKIEKLSEELKETLNELKALKEKKNREIHKLRTKLKEQSNN
ncbi:hypothetical protein [Clostridium butyricum]|uniref:RepC n=2 Tax=Clostridium butyricum TaxID=1492 RepID=Q45961_CLOBU|nr:hypothetical protein [Clostridium butyricum]MBZ5748626.1 hypothetical protein [Clostridium butyricum]QMW93450.1 hypothetical protein FF104_21260 [Clostridium butyricum]BBK79244.1 hypothetical protein Cbu04g_42520 [Clostridium butyricum]CAA44561.1 RepC [Clostridium butyricum]